MTRYSYFPGCSAESTARSSQIATEYVMSKLGIDLIEIKDWNCCGATAGHTLSEPLGLALPARSLAQAEKDYPDYDIVTGCASCYARLKLTAHRVRTEKDAGYMVEQILRKPYKAKREVYTFLDILDSEEMFTKIEKSLMRRFYSLKVACYYGCLNIRPCEVTGAKDRENPGSMDRIAALTGAEPVEWSYKTECCGASHQNAAAAEAHPLVWRILDNARKNGAELILTACPMCNLNLEMRQSKYASKHSGGEKIPVISITELLAIAMGAGGKRLELQTHHVPAGGILNTALSGQESEVLFI